MENNLPTLTESEKPNSASQVVADVHAQKTKKNKFLQNVGIWNGHPQSGMWGSSVLDIQIELDTEKRANAELWLIVNTQREQMDDLSQQVKETEAARIRDQEEMKKQQAELSAKLDLLLG
jgi:tRNA(Phe) wybutosine-synthesizing methylase Tyw3